MTKAKATKKTNKPATKKKDYKPKDSKETIRVKIVEYLANPDNKPPTRTELALILGYSEVPAMYKMTPAVELDKLYDEALELRRKRYAASLMDVDRGQLKSAAKGDSAAAKLIYQRFEGWSEKKLLGVGGPDGGPLTIEVVRFGDDKPKD